MMSPLAHEDYRAYLRAWLKQTSPPRSVRSLAKGLGCSATLLQAILNEDSSKQRRMGPHLVRNFCRLAALNDEDARGFGLLVILSDGSPGERDAARSELATIRRFQVARSLGTEQGRFLEKWYLPAIFELAKCEGFQADPDWISPRLLPSIAPEVAREALERLTTLGLLTQGDDGQIRATPDVRLDHESPEARLALARWHQWLCERGAKAVDEVPRNERFYGAITISLPEAMVPMITARIEGLLKEVLAQCGATTERRERVFQLNVQMYPVSASLRSGS